MNHNFFFFFSQSVVARNYMGKHKSTFRCLLQVGHINCETFILEITQVSKAVYHKKHHWTSKCTFTLFIPTVEARSLYTLIMDINVMAVLGFQWFL